MTTITDELEVAICCSCGIAFGVQKSLLTRRRDDGKGFGCPNGHWQSFTTSPAKKLEEVTAERNQWQKEAERLLEQCDELRSDNAKLRLDQGKPPKPVKLRFRDYWRQR